jgi:hypothetical protein
VSKGDRVEIVVEAGDGSRVYEVTALVEHPSADSEARLPGGEPPEVP